MGDSVFDDPVIGDAEFGDSGFDDSSAVGTPCKGIAVNWGNLNLKVMLPAFAGLFATG